VEEVRTEGGIKYIARWQYYVADPEAAEGRRRESGYHEIGPKAHHGPRDALTSKGAAEKKWAEIRDCVMGRTTVLPAALKAEKTLRWWAEEDQDGFRKRREQRWSGGTPQWYDYITAKIYAKFGDTKIKDLKEQDLQAFLNKLADDRYSESVVKNARLYLRAILNEALQCRIIDVNPAARLTKPRNTRKPQRPWLELEEYQQIFDGTPSQRDRLMMKILYIGGVRRGELFGLQWRDFEAKGMLNIERQILDDGTVGPAKTDGSIAPVAISADIVEDLKEWHKWCPNPASEGWIFSTERGAHINPTQWRKKVLIPAGEKIGIVKLDFRMFRRAFATEGHDHGMTDKTIQGQMRHASPNTARNIYMQTIPESQRAAVEEFSKVVNVRNKKPA
jgi:integrase